MQRVLVGSLLLICLSATNVLAGGTARRTFRSIRFPDVKTKPYVGTQGLVLRSRTLFDARFRARTHDALGRHMDWNAPTLATMLRYHLPSRTFKVVHGAAKKRTVTDLIADDPVLVEVFSELGDYAGFLAENLSALDELDRTLVPSMIRARFNDPNLYSARRHRDGKNIYYRASVDLSLAEEAGILWVDGPENSSLRERQNQLAQGDTLLFTGMTWHGPPAIWRDRLSILIDFRVEP